MQESIISGHCDPRFEKVHEAFSSSFKEEFEVGASVAIENQGEIVVNLWGLYQDASKKKTWEEDTIVNVFSTTKGVTATCIAKLIDEGLLDIEKKVSHYWPEYGCNGKEDTKVSDLLCHRAGMFGFQEGLPINQWMDWDKFIEILEKQAPFHKPGSSQGYHALTYGWLVGEVVRRVDGRTVGQYFKEEIADPLNIDFKIGLDTTDLDRCAETLLLSQEQNAKSPLEYIRYVPDFILPRQLKNLKDSIKGGHFLIAFESNSAQDEDYVNSQEWRKAEIPSANGHGTAKSLAKLYGILSTGCSRDSFTIMKPETIQLATTPLSSGPDSVLFGSDITFGLGYEVGNRMTNMGNMSPKFSNKMFGHAGVGGTVAFGDLDKGLGYAFLCNKQHELRKLYKTSNELVDALYTIV